MRATVLAVVLVVSACSGSSAPAARSSPSATITAIPSDLQPSSPRPPLASSGVVEYSVPNPSRFDSPGCFNCGTSDLRGIVSGRDGNLWFVDVGQGKVGRMTPSGVITEFDVPSPSAVVDGIIAGPDGNIWVASPNFGVARPYWILRISPAGDVTRFPVGDLVVDQAFGAIAAGPDGNIWLTEFSVDRIGRMTPAGALTEFPLTPKSGPGQIVAGPDGNVWFSESSNVHTHNAIARITPSGKVTEFSLDTPDGLRHFVTGIVAGPDGNIWFTEAGGPYGRITPAGEITRFPLSGSNLIQDLAVGPDGNLWFTNWFGDGGGSNVGWISPNGAIGQFALPRLDARPLGIAAGADGRLWFTEEGVSRIASLGVTVH